MKAWRLVAVVALVLSLGACDDDPVLVEEAGEATPEVIEPSFITPSPVPTVLPSPVPSAIVTSPGAPAAPGPEVAALRLYGYWLAEDPVAALNVATQRAVDQLFDTPPSEIEFTGCEAEAVNFACFFSYEGGGLNMIVQPSAQGGYVVGRTFFVAD